MTRLMISAIASVALLAAATGMLRSHSFPTNAVRTAGMPTVQELQSAAGVEKLPVQEFEDRSLVYPRETKH
jgi:hypothetical protein